MVVLFIYETFHLMLIDGYIYSSVSVSPAMVVVNPGLSDDWWLFPSSSSSSLGPSHAICKVCSAHSSGRCSVSVWGAISKYGRGPLVRIKGPLQSIALPQHPHRQHDAVCPWWPFQGRLLPPSTGLKPCPYNACCDHPASRVLWVPAAVAAEWSEPQPHWEYVGLHQEV